MLTLAKKRILQIVRSTTTLRFKSTIAVTVFLVVIAVALSTLYVGHAERAEEQNAFRSAIDQTTVLAAALGRELGDGANPDKLASLLQSVRALPSVLYGSLQDTEGTIAASMGSFPVDAADEPAGTISRTSRVLGPIETPSGPILDVTIPVRTELGGDPVAELRLGVSYVSARNRIYELRLRATVDTAIVILLGAMGTLFLVGTIVNPIQDLAHAAARFSEGDFDFHKRATSHDEVGVLTESFNDMAQYLREARDRHAAFQEVLAERVQKKTREIDQTREHLANVVENVGASIIVADLDGTVVSANTHTMHIFGAKPEWIVGRNLREFTCDPAHDHALLKRLLTAAGSPLTYEAKYRVDRRSETDLLITHTLLRGADGEAAGILQITKDVSQLKQMEQRLVDADRLSRMGEMAGEIGHELNNYLMAIGGRAELMLLALDGGNSQKVRRSAELIAEQVSEMRKLTDGLLDSARTERSPIHMDLNELVEASVDFVRPQNKFDQIRIELVLEPGPLPVFADPQQLRQIVLNLLVNGAESIHEHRGRQGGEIKIETFRSDGHAGFRVSDTGAGIDEETGARIFEPHFTTKEKGHGFGLAVCHRVVTNHGGRISVHSTPGNGATFDVDLPIAETVAQTASESRRD